MNTGHHRHHHRPAAPFWTLVLASLAVLAFIISGAVLNAQQSSQGTAKPSSSKAHQTQKPGGGQPAKGTAQQPVKTTEQPTAAATQAPAQGGAPAGQSSGQTPEGGAQQPFVMPNEPMCPCPLVTKDPVEKRFQEVCGRCHTPERITGIKKSGLEWKETIDKMILKGAQVGDEDYDVILAFLVRNFDRVDINWVESGELVVALGLTPEEAEKIVAYRKEHGDFKDFESLAKVPGVDVKKLEAKKSSIVFY